jgi:hypothetical protein
MKRAWLILPLTACTVTLVGYPRDSGSDSEDASVDQRAPIPDRALPPPQPDAPAPLAACDGIDGGVAHPDSGACYYRVDTAVTSDAAPATCGDGGAILATGVTSAILGDAGLQLPAVGHWVHSVAFGPDASCVTGDGGCCNVKPNSTGAFITDRACTGTAAVICERR